MEQAALQAPALPSPLAQLQLAREDFQTWERDASHLMQGHFDEVNAGIEPRRKFKLDSQAMVRAEALGIVRIYTARIETKLVGYCTWGLEFDPESLGLLIGHQGAWYVEPSKVGCGLRLMRYCIKDLRQAGVKFLILHHRMQGRAVEKLGKYFRSLGAKPIQMNYALWIGE